MTRSVFLSFDYDDNWRVQKIMRMGALTDTIAFTYQDWEEVKRKTDTAIEKWIHDQMKYTKAVIVLVGPETASSRWVRYEITKAWNDKRPLLGVRIHALLDRNNRPGRPGANPFQRVPLKGGGTLADHVELIDPAGADSKAVYADIEANLQKWVDTRARTRA